MVSEVFEGNMVSEVTHYIFKCCYLLVLISVMNLNVVLFHKCFAGPVYHKVPDGNFVESSELVSTDNIIVENLSLFSVWRQQFVDATKVSLLSEPLISNL